MSNAPHPHTSRGEPPREKKSWRELVEPFRHTRRAIELVWRASPGLSTWLGVASVVAGLLPAAITWVGKLIVDGVVRAATSGSAADRVLAVRWVAIELALVVGLAAVTRSIDACQSLLRAILGQRVNEMILEKALTLELPDFEDSELYDRMTRARREASSRPLSLVRRAFGLVQSGISIAAYGALMVRLSPWVALVLVAAAVPAFVAETRFSRDAFRLFRWRAPEARKQMYLETVLAREDYAKEVQLYGIGPLLLARYRAIFDDLYLEDRNLTLRRTIWGYPLGLVSTGAFYGAYAWIAVEAMLRHITLGEMTMYLLLFKQGQSTLASIFSSIGGMYEDNLYLSTLYEFLEHESPSDRGGATAGPDPSAGLVVEDVRFRYPAAKDDVLRGVSLSLKPGEKLALVGDNGAGKTTLIKLIARLYRPTAGRILLDGLDVAAWDRSALHARLAVIFQDFVRYQLLVGENVGAGDVSAFDDEERWRAAAAAGLAAPVIDALPDGYRTQLGTWFKGGRELSLGQWQKVALSRVFMRADADLLVLDEPTASMDAEAEAQMFERLRDRSAGKMAILISHRFSTVRMADRIAVLENGRVSEYGSHQELLDKNGHYAHLFRLQAHAYQ